MKSYLKLCLISVCFILTACQTIPKDAFKLNETALQERQLQSRKFHTNDELSILAAGAGVLQDMGYAIEETEKKAGLITASKNTDATDGGQVALAVVVALLGGGASAIDKEQKIKVSLVINPSHNEKNTYIVRVTFQRVVWDTNNRVTKAESVKDVEIYQGFFDKLSKSVFLEAHSI